MGRELREVVYVDGVRTAFGRAGAKGIFWRTRADDLGVKVVRELLRRNPQLPPERIDDVVMAATAQVGDQGLTLGRDVALLAGLPQTVPGFAVDRMCAGALTAVTAGAGEIAMGAADVVLAGGIEHMGHHPMGEDVDFNPRFVAERLVDPSAVTMGATAEHLHDRYPQLTKDDADAFAVRSQQRAAAAWQNGVMRETVVPMSVFTDQGWRLADRDEFLRPDTSLEGLAGLPTPFRAGGRVTAGNSAGLTDGAAVCLLAARETAEELGLEPRMRLVSYAYAGVEPELMGLGPVPATRKALEHAELSLDDIGLIELNEPFAVQVLSWCDAFGVDPEDERLNPYGGAIACGHPLAATGVRLLAQLAYGFRERPAARYGLTPLCASGWAWAPHSSGRTSLPGTEFKLARVDTEAGAVALVTIDNGEDHTKPTFFGRAALASLERAPAAARRGRLGGARPHRQAVRLRRGRGHRRSSRERPASSRSRAAAPATSCSAGSARSRTRRWRRSTAPASAEGSSWRSTATRARSRPPCGTSPARSASSGSSRPGAERSSSRGSSASKPRSSSSSPTRCARTGCSPGRRRSSSVSPTALFDPAEFLDESLAFALDWLAGRFRGTVPRTRPERTSSERRTPGSTGRCTAPRPPPTRRSS